MINQLSKRLLAIRTVRSVGRYFGGATGEPNNTPVPLDLGSGYYIDPENVAMRAIRILTLHDNLKNPDNLTLRKTFNQLGVDDLSKVEIFLEMEKEFDIEFANEDVERFKNMHEAVEHIAKSFHAK